MESQPKRTLIKGPLRPPEQQISSLSYTQPRASKDEMSVRNSKEDIKVIEFYSRAVPQPFLDSSIIQRRIQVDNQWKLDQERKRKQAEASGAS